MAENQEPQFEFAAPTFYGARFNTEKAALPVEVLADLATYQAIVAELAAAIFRGENNRRLPPNFKETFTLSLTAIDKGSGVAVLEAPQIGVHADYFLRGRDEVPRIIAAINEGKQLGAPPQVLPLFASLGRKWMTDDGSHQGISFRPNRTSPNGIVFHQETRRTFERLASKEVILPVDLEGEVIGTQSRPKRNFSLRTTSIGDVRVPFKAHQYDMVAKAWRDSAFVRVLVKGHLGFKKGKPGEFVGEPVVTLTSGVSEAIVNDLEGQLRAFESLEKGWDDDDSVPVSAGTIAWVRSVLLEAVAQHQLPVPLLSPTTGGGIKASWKFRPWYLTAEFEADQTALLHGLNVADDTESQLELSFADESLEGSVFELAHWVTTRAPHP